MDTTTSRRWTTVGTAVLVVALVALATVAWRAAVRPAHGSDASVAGGAQLSQLASNRSPDGFAECLEQVGVPATVSDGGGLQVTGPGSLSMSRNADGTMRRLSIGGTDYAEAYNTCLGQFPDAGVDPDRARALEEELRLLADPVGPAGDTAVADEAAGQWVGCAREHGVDSAPDPRDGTVTIPGDLDVDTARRVAEACPLSEFGSFGLGISAEQGLPADGVMEALTGGSLRLQREDHDPAAPTT
ncbi:hypothetical protein [Cellulomonas denverensis]|uniref:hypothetical protein n=1 Tax=Cellulomonas denverensis TaxID=264297 RepID=UPI0035EED39B